MGLAHSWGTATTNVLWSANSGSVQQAVAHFLKVPDNTIAISPHPDITRMLPLWVGKRRWAQSRKRYKALINRQRDQVASIARKGIDEKWTAQHPRVAKAIRGLSWNDINRMEGVTAYQTQNICRLKLHRLRLWAGPDKGFRCTSDGCTNAEGQGVAHLIWACPETQEFWKMMLEAWGIWGKHLPTRKADRGSNSGHLRLQNEAGPEMGSGLEY